MTSSQSLASLIDIVFRRVCTSIVIALDMVVATIPFCRGRHPYVDVRRRLRIYVVSVAMDSGGREALQEIIDIVEEP